MEEYEAWERIQDATKQHIRESNAGFYAIDSKNGKEVFIVCCGCGKCIEVIDNVTQKIPKRTNSKT